MSNRAKHAFSLIEMMISLVIICLIAASFAPVITKKLTNSIINLGGDTTSKLNTNCMENCTLCQGDKCLLCNTGYSYDKDNNVCINCSKTYNENTLECNASGPTRCKKGYYIESNTCVQCSIGYYCPDGKNKNQCSKAGYTSNVGATSDDECFPSFTKAEFSETTTWTVPNGVKKVKMTLVAGGSGGKNGTADANNTSYTSAGSYEFDATGIDTIDFIMCGAGGNPGGNGAYVSNTNVSTSDLKTNGNKIGFYVGGNSGTCSSTVTGGTGGSAGVSGNGNGGWAFGGGGYAGSAGGAVCGGKGGAGGTCSECATAESGGRGGDATAFYAKYSTTGFFASGGGGNGGNARYCSFTYNWEDHVACNWGGGGGGGGGFSGAGKGGQGGGDNGGCNAARSDGASASGANTASAAATFGSNNCVSGKPGAMIITYYKTTGGDGGSSGKVYINNSVSVTPGSKLTITIGAGGSAGNSGGATTVTGSGVNLSSASGTAGAGGSANGSIGGVGGVATITGGPLCTAAQATQSANGYGCGGGGGSGTVSAGAGRSGYVLIENI